MDDSETAKGSGWSQTQGGLSFMVLKLNQKSCWSHSVASVLTEQHDKGKCN